MQIPTSQGWRWILRRSGRAEGEHQGCNRPSSQLMRFRLGWAAPGWQPALGCGHHPLQATEAAAACFRQPSARPFQPKPQQHSAGTWPRSIRSQPGGHRRSQTNRAFFVVALRGQGQGLAIAAVIAAVIAAAGSRACGPQTSARSAFTSSPTAPCRHGPDHRPLAPRLRATRRRVPPPQQPRQHQQGRHRGWRSAAAAAGRAPGRPRRSW